MNILITSAGRRSYMVSYFRQALDGRGLVYAANSQMSPALLKSDSSFLTPLIYEEDYIPFLLGKCRELEIGLLVSLFDIDLPVLAAHRAEFAAVGTKLALSGPGLLDICSDKLKMCDALSGAGLAVPETWTDPEEALSFQEKNQALSFQEKAGAFSFLVKPRFGMGSIGVLTAADRTELEGAFSICRRTVEESYLRYESSASPDKVLIQRLIRGEEYGLDVICDLDGRFVNTIIRKKYAMRSGETDEAVILGESDPAYGTLFGLGRRLAAQFRPQGLIDVDVILEEPAGAVPYVIDINARFGGGYPFSHAAGANVPKAYILWAEGRQEEADRYCRATPGVRGYKEIVPEVF